ncbi:peptide methionine sulfoxide reductase MsrA [Kockovaella imperatae]|uniref:peptide-methionine (S)-S-oxide reductase n=1 Tax=Kockovaella imperatae TaxID=4999 RepID=A0A1Y1UR76_9TREE|nr:peptide methionine sulfoxide reductase MsrA [Kockovaella imperatae]ORX40479.1 peptide methionine sulfoxide reductase MsrA [Kockovaella imperatae]
MASSIRSLFGKLAQPTGKMVKTKTPPPPTVPTAIKAREEAEKAGPGEGLESAVFTAGCFWGTEHLFNQYYSTLPGYKIVSGYAGGDVPNPSYRQVCMGGTGHAEGVQVTYQKGAVGYGELVEFFYRTHDPTQAGGQGPDRGDHYRSGIFFNSKEQEEIAKQVTKEVQEKYFKGKTIVTEITQLKKFYSAEDYHQQYLDKNPWGYECPTHFMHW